MQIDQWRNMREGTIYVVVAVLSFYLNLLPLGTSFTKLSMPDLLYCATVAWVMRRPSSANLALVAAVSLLADILLARPLGLWTFFILLSSEYFRGRETGKGIQMRLIEWLSVSVVFGLMLLGQALVLKVSLSPTPSFQAMTWHVMTTVAAYPLVVSFLYWVIGIRAPLPADKSRSIGRVT